MFVGKTITSTTRNVDLKRGNNIEMVKFSSNVLFIHAFSTLESISEELALVDQTKVSSTKINYNSEKVNVNACDLENDLLNVEMWKTQAIGI